MNLEQRRISPSVGLLIVTVLKRDAPYERGYHNEQGGLLSPSSTSVEETQEAPAQEEEQVQPGRRAEGVRQGRRQRYLVHALDGMPVEGHPFGVSSSVVYERFQRWRMGIFEKLMNWMVEHYAKESGGIGWEWQAMDSKTSPAPLGGEKTGKNPSDRGKRRSHLCRAHRRQSSRRRH
jgi:hypothetical protein